eukprot:CAMPEP_0197539046 /NCGR_PEP_ID=MMETSP1318-20131121/61493_1 /TAXON_ID=552666 /ORGANISM="Partenskyella glossopodia, Strain RCC365" /LENGTH=264 /DNA_ID=CAMNT_0043097651 /DNA_START=98 /DNA_END=892 /DNA_ORIENTATION=-
MRKFCGQSLFQRLEAGGQKPWLLSIQYRMHPEICSFPSRMFYASKLKNANQLERRPPPLSWRSDLSKPYMFFDLPKSHEQLGESGNSYRNDSEARFACALYYQLESVLRRNEDQKLDSQQAQSQRDSGTFPRWLARHIGIITPYKRQIRTLRRMFSKYGLDQIEINTVDGFQGREKDIIIVSCVRSKRGGGSIGFLKDKQRMNVSITRARYALYIIGNVETLSCDLSWKALILDAQSRGVLQRVSYSTSTSEMRDYIEALSWIR